MMSSSKSSSVTSVSKEEKAASLVAEEDRLKSPSTSEFEYMGRLVTYERPTLKKSKSAHHHHRHHHEHRSKRQHHEHETASSFDAQDAQQHVVKVNDRHIREFYRLPTPPPQVKQVYHRARSPKPKIIERVYIRRPAPEIIENIIQVPPERVKIINREKVLPAAKPIIRTKYVYLKAEDEQPVAHPPQPTVYQVTQPTCFTYQPPPMPFTHQY